MIFFVRQVEYYCHLEVVACQWAELEDFVAKKEGDLDQLVDAHRKYLTKLTDKALLKAQGRRKKDVKPLVEQLRDIWKVMLQWKNVAVRPPLPRLHAPGLALAPLANAAPLSPPQDDLFAYAMQHESYARATADSTRVRRSPPRPLGPLPFSLADLLPPRPHSPLHSTSALRPPSSSRSSRTASRATAACSASARPSSSSGSSAAPTST